MVAANGLSSKSFVRSFAPIAARSTCAHSSVETRVERQVKARLIQRIEHLRRRRYGQAYGFQQFDLREDLLRCSVRENAPRVHNDHALGADRFGHMMGDEHHGDAHFPFRRLDGRNDLLAPVGSSMAVGSSSTMQRGRMAMTPQWPRRCFCPPEQVRRVQTVVIHPDELQCFVHASADSSEGTPRFSGAKATSSSTTLATI